MGNQNARNQDNVPLAPYNASENYQPQMGAYGNNQYSINSNYSAANDMPNPQYPQHQNVQLQNQQQSIPNQTNIPNMTSMPPIPPIPTHPIQLGIPVIQSLEIGQIPQQAITNDLKDQPFHVKKKEIIKALIIKLKDLLGFSMLQPIFNEIIIKFYKKRRGWSYNISLNANNLKWIIIVYRCILRSIQDGWKIFFNNLPHQFYLQPCSCYNQFTMTQKFQQVFRVFYRQNPRAIINSFLIILFYSLTIISYFYFQSKQATIKKADSYMIGVIYVVLVLQSITNCIVIAITILYFAIEQRQVRFEIYFLMLCFAGFITIMIEIWLLLFVCTAFIFGTLLMVVLQQLMNGRFQLKKNQSFGLCNAIYLGILVPCNIF